MYAASHISIHLFLIADPTIDPAVKASGRFKGTTLYHSGVLASIVWLSFQIMEIHDICEFPFLLAFESLVLLPFMVYHPPAAVT